VGYPTVHPSAPTEAFARRGSAVDIAGLEVRFGSVEAVRGPDLQLAAGATTAPRGRNGTGRPTPMRVLTRAVPRTQGRVLVVGYDVRTDRLAVTRLTGYCFDVGRRRVSRWRTS
jgi:ABC-2 type transport system ATP-binding protein